MRVYEIRGRLVIRRLAQRPPRASRNAGRPDRSRRRLDQSEQAPRLDLRARTIARGAATPGPVRPVHARARAASPRLADRHGADDHGNREHDTTEARHREDSTSRAQTRHNESRQPAVHHRTPRSCQISRYPVSHPIRRTDTFRRPPAAGLTVSIANAQRTR